MSHFVLLALVAAVSVMLVAPQPAWAEPEPGDVFREYSWHPRSKWQRVTYPEVEEKRARAFLPNAVNEIEIDDLDKAKSAEVCVEVLLCHAGTVGKRIRINGGDWIDIPESPQIPGKRGKGGDGTDYQSMCYPTFGVPLESLKEGKNTIEFTCAPGNGLGKWWPQWLVYGAVVRIYYDESKPHPTGKIISHQSGDVLGEDPTFEVEADQPDRVKRVDLVGRYEDYNWRGDGVSRGWQYRYSRGEIASHIGSAKGQPFRVAWDTEWIPTQAKPIRIAARIVDRDGLIYLTPAVERLKLKRSYTVRMYEPYDIPLHWATRAGETDACRYAIRESLDRASKARVFMCTWNGVVAEDIRVNDTKIDVKIGRNHELSYDQFEIPVASLRTGENVLSIHSQTHHHGCEVQWPGPVVMVRVDQPER